MKKILVIIVALFGCLGVKAQSITLYNYHPISSLNEIDLDAVYVLGYQDGNDYYLHTSGTEVGEMLLSKNPQSPCEYTFTYNPNQNRYHAKCNDSYLYITTTGAYLGSSNVNMISYYSLTITDSNISSAGASGYTVYHDGNIIKSHTGSSNGNLRFFECKQQQNNEIWYSSTNGQKVVPSSTDVFGATIQSNVYYSERNMGIITFNGEVTSIGSNAFYDCNNLASSTIPNSVTSIGSYAFAWCPSLASVTIPNSVTNIGERAFLQCTSLASVTIPNGVTSIGESTFYSCTSLASVTIPNGVTSIGERAFDNCTSLVSVAIPNSVTSIGKDAFKGCTSLPSITIPSGVTSIGDDAFDGCTGLTSVTINSDALLSVDFLSNMPKMRDVFGTQVTEYTIGPSVTKIGLRAFTACSNLETLTFAPNSQLQIIGLDAFSDCTSLSSITIPASVTNIGNWAFTGCTGITQVIFEGNACENNIPDRVFGNIGSQSPAQLTLPLSWAFEYLPEEGETWHGGNFISNRYFDLDEYKAYVCAQITAAFNELTYYLESELNSCINAINASSTKAEVNTQKRNALNCIALRRSKNEAKAEIEAQRDLVTDWSEAEISVIAAYLDAIENCSSTNDVSSTLQDALNCMAQHGIRASALAAITNAMGEYANINYLQELVTTEIDNINNATDAETITANKEAALAKLAIAVPAIEVGQAMILENLPTEGTTGPAVRITKQGKSDLILINPDKVEFIKIEEIEE
ncbi:MAG: leucine-rich repeat domain-containing protein [Bacteroidales bacterium]|nr:leucine-rich repeat domain-containing protein [Bacteroidales bacterium]